MTFGGTHSRTRGRLWILALLAAVGLAVILSNAAVEATQPLTGDEGFSVIRTGWLADHALPHADVAPADRVGAAFADGVRWCLGDDTDLDPSGDAGPDLVWFGMTGACEPEGLVRIEVRTITPPEVLELLFDTDHDESAGCDGIDAVTVVLHGTESRRLSTPSCDTDGWVVSPGNFVRTRVEADAFLTEAWVPGEDARNSVWSPGVGNLDGSGYDTSWQRYYTSNRWLDCQQTSSANPDAADGYWLIGIDGSVHAFGSAPDLGTACVSGLGASQIADFELAF
jgi:hypothetical protein